MAVCHIHSDRPAVGVCMRCRGEICAGCCTRLDGVNHCSACLRQLGRTAARPDVSAGLRVTTALVLWGLATLALLDWRGWGRASWRLWIAEGAFIVSSAPLP